MLGNVTIYPVMFLHIESYESPGYIMKSPLFFTPSGYSKVQDGRGAEDNNRFSWCASINAYQHRYTVTHYDLLYVTICIALAGNGDSIKEPSK